MEQLIKIGEAARFLGCHPDSILYYEKKGTIHPFRNHAGVRFITKEDFEKLKTMFTPRQVEKDRQVFA